MGTSRVQERHEERDREGGDPPHSAPMHQSVFHEFGGRVEATSTLTKDQEEEVPTGAALRPMAEAEYGRLQGDASDVCVTRAKKKDARPGSPSLQPRFSEHRLRNDEKNATCL
jgi:hypothetical protein